MFSLCDCRCFIWCRRHKEAFTCSTIYSGWTTPEQKIRLLVYINCYYLSNPSIISLFFFFFISRWFNLEKTQEKLSLLYLVWMVCSFLITIWWLDKDDLNGFQCHFALFLSGNMLFIRIFRLLFMWFYCIESSVRITLSTASAR